MILDAYICYMFHTGRCVILVRNRICSYSFKLSFLGQTRFSPYKPFYSQKFSWALIKFKRLFHFIFGFFSLLGDIVSSM